MSLEGTENQSPYCLADWQRRRRPWDTPFNGVLRGTGELSSLLDGAKRESRCKAADIVKASARGKYRPGWSMRNRRYLWEKWQPLFPFPLVRQRKEGVKRTCGDTACPSILWDFQRFLIFVSARRCFFLFFFIFNSCCPWPRLLYSLFLWQINNN